MNTESINTTQNAIQKKPYNTKTHRQRPSIARKVVAFEELISLSNKKSNRKAAALLEVPNSTMQSWRRVSEESQEELAVFLDTPAGSEFLQRVVMSVMKLVKCGPSGIHGIQMFLRESKLNQFVASSEGALQKFWVRCEEHIIEFGKREESRLSLGMKKRKITAGLDEMFRGRRPCLVAIEVVSNYILLEKFTEDRTAVTWKSELDPRLSELNIEVGQIVSDLCGAIRLTAKEYGAEHSADLFHGQHEISKATSAALSSQERAAEKAYNKAKKAVKKHSSQPQRIVAEYKVQQEKYLKKLENERDFCKKDYEKKKKRRNDVKEAKKELGRVYHPIDLKTGKIQSPRVVKKKMAEQFDIIKNKSFEAGLSVSSFCRIEKSERAFDLMCKYIRSYFIFFFLFVIKLGFSLKKREFFKEVVFPLCYLNMIWKRLPKQEKIRLQGIKRDLQKKFNETQGGKEHKEALMRIGKEACERFQRSSSCVEGRNATLSLRYHLFRRLNARSLKALSIIYNFTSRRSDGTTAAERFFNAWHKDLFSSLVKHVRIPNRPQRQNHDLKRRLEGRKKWCAA